MLFAVFPTQDEKLRRPTPWSSTLLEWKSLVTVWLAASHTEGMRHMVKPWNAAVDSATKAHCFCFVRASKGILVSRKITPANAADCQRALEAGIHLCSGNFIEDPAEHMHVNKQGFWQSALTEFWKVSLAVCAHNGYGGIKLSSS